MTAGLPALLNDLRRTLLTLQPQQAEQAAAQLHELALEMPAVGAGGATRGAVFALQELAKATAGDSVTADCENGAALQLLQALQQLCSAAVASCAAADGGSSAPEPRRHEQNGGGGGASCSDGARAAAGGGM